MSTTILERKAEQFAGNLAALGSPLVAYSGGVVSLRAYSGVRILALGGGG